MQVRDLTKPKTEYRGRPTHAAAKDCPCMPCYSPHDCGHTNSQGKWKRDMRCLTRYRSGCPDKESVHIYQGRGRKCKRCGCWKPKEQAG